MNTRERFLAAMNYGNLDRVPFWEFWGFEKETINRWRCEGLMNMDVTDFFGLDTWELIQIDTGPIPSFVPRTISGDERSRIEVREDGVTVRVLKNRPTIIYSGIYYPIKDRKDFDKIKKRYNPMDPPRKNRVKIVKEDQALIEHIEKGWILIKELNHDNIY